jgi:hypothetical protein
MTDRTGLDMRLALLSSCEDILVRPSPVAGRSTTTGAVGKSDDQRTESTGRRGGSSTRGGEAIDNPSIDGAVDEGPLGYIILSQFCGIWLSATNGSDRTLEVGTRPARSALGGPTVKPEGVENVSIVEVGGDEPFGRVPRKDGGEGTIGDSEGVRLSVIVERWVRRMDPTTDSVCEGGVGTRQGGATVRARWGGSTIGIERGPEWRSNGMRGVRGPFTSLNWGVMGEEGSDGDMGGKPGGRGPVAYAEPGPVPAEKPRKPPREKRDDAAGAISAPYGLV